MKYNLKDYTKETLFQDKEEKQQPQKEKTDNTWMWLLLGAVVLVGIALYKNTEDD